MKKIKEMFLKMKLECPEKFVQRLNLSWSNWGFGMENLVDSVQQLQRAGIEFIELHGNRYGEDLGYKSVEAEKVLSDNGIRVSGICGRCFYIGKYRRCNRTDPFC